MFKLTYELTKKNNDTIPTADYGKVQELKAQGYTVTPIYTEIPRKMPHKSNDEYRQVIEAILRGKKYQPVWNRVAEA